MSDLDELKRLAQAATPGEWSTEDFSTVISLLAGRRCLAEWLNPSEGDKADASFIAAANPSAVLALIERVEGLEKSLRVLAKREGFDGLPCWCSRGEIPRHELDPHGSWCMGLREPLVKRPLEHLAEAEEAK